METIIIYIIDGLALAIPAFIILRYGMQTIPAGILIFWLLPLLQTHIIGPRKESTESDFYWLLFGWQIALAYALILWAIRVVFRFCLSLYRRKKISEEI